jgi:hypothetical protein
MAQELIINSKLNYEFSDGGYSVLIFGEGRPAAHMRKILDQLKSRFGEKLQAAGLLDDDTNAQIIFKEGCIPTGREITEAMSALDLTVSPEEAQNGEDAPSEENFFRKLLSKLAKLAKIK